MNDRIENFEDFKQILGEVIREYLPEEYKEGIIRFGKVKKSGIGEVTGMTIRNEGDVLAPCLYIDSAYEEHLKYGVLIDAIAESMGRKLAESLEDREQLTMDSSIRELISGGFSWDAAKGNCFLKAVPVSNNEGYLMNMPHRTQGDIAAIYQVDLGEVDQGQMTVSITNDLAEVMGVSEEVLFQVAMQNMMEKKTPHIVPIENSMMRILMGTPLSFGETFQEELEQLPDTLNDDTQVPLNILTNNEAMNGAAALFSQKTMDGLAQKYPKGFYILPSSIHEAMIVEKGKLPMSLDEMNEMVKEINETEVSPWERLSDYVHEYDPVSKSLYIAGTDAPSKNMEAEMQKLNMAAHKR